MLLVEDIENSDFLKMLFEAMFKELPEQKRKKGIRNHLDRGACMFIEKKTTKERLLPFYNKLKNAWCKESCSASLRENWPNENVAKGQCFVTAVAVRDTFGGEVFELHNSEEDIHYE